MDERLLKHYEEELAHLREMASEFGREFPKIAGRLAFGQEPPDPYVERLMEGFAFLAARVHLKLDAEFPRFTQSLLETVYPHYLNPIPSMCIVRFDPEEQEGGLAEGFKIPRGTTIRSSLGKGERTPCTFQTAQDVKLLPLKIAEVRYFTRDVSELNLPPEPKAKAAIRIRLQSTAAVPFEQMDLDSLTFFIRGTTEFPELEFPDLIYEQIFSRKVGLAVQSAAERGRTLAYLSPSNIRRVGFSDDEALLPPSPRGFEGYRLLREYFAFPQRYLFFQLTGIETAAKLCQGEYLDLIIALKEQEPTLEKDGCINASCFELFCSPAINLFSKQIDRISLSDRFSEFHVVPDRNRPLDFEIFELEQVTGYADIAGFEQEFRPFYLVRDNEREASAFYTLNRVPRVLTAREKQAGKKSSYSGSEVYLSLVDANAAPYSSDLKELGIKALCTNRHLPIQMAVGLGRTDFTMDLSAPCTAIRCVRPPTLPIPSQAEGRFSWKLVNHLSLNYHSLLDPKGKSGANAIKEILELYAGPNDRDAAKQIEGLKSVKSVPIIRRVETPGPITFARGLEVTIDFDETAYKGTGIFILGSVLEQFLAKYVSMNSFTETVIKSEQRGEIIRWPAQVGRRQII